MGASFRFYNRKTELQGMIMAMAGKMAIGAMILALGLGGLVIVHTVSSATSAQRQAGLPVSIDAGAEAEQKRRAELDRTVFAQETEAQRHEQWFYRRWDEARAAKHAWSVLTDIGVSSLRLGKPGSVMPHDWGVTVTPWKASAEDPAIDQAGWAAQIAKWQADGFRVIESEWHLPKFEHLPGKPATSSVNFIVHAVNDRDQRRIVVRGRIDIVWRAASDPTGTPSPDDVTVADVMVVERTGKPAFVEVTAQAGVGVDMSGPYAFLHPVLVYDLDRDGLPDIILPSDNKLFRNRGGMRFEAEPLCSVDLEVETGVIADFDSDGLPDLLISDHKVLKLMRGLPGGRFADPVVAADIPPVDVGQCLTTADIDGDGHLDVLLSQYLEPYRDGQMPTPYFDSNDGYPLYLLHNDGRGHFTDITVGSGLEAKRHRRISVASFVDLNEDAKPDLVLTCDFAGHDLFLNDGKGHFRDVSDTLIDDRHNFGMGHCFADYDRDGHLDMYLIGMSSTTARRLTAMQAGLDKFPKHQELRPAMGYGNRMFLGQGAGKPYKAAPWKEQVNRTGWSWGGVSPDFDNNGFPDLYVTNGFVSAESCQDYCTSFWRHDIYTGSSKPNPGLNLFFKKDTDFRKVSWNGYEHNVLFLNEAAPTEPGKPAERRFLNIAHLMDVAKEYDARAVVAADLDNDGHMDLVVEERNNRTSKRYLHIYRNEWPSAGNHWIGAHLQESPNGANIPNTLVTIMAGGVKYLSPVINGDSFLCQHPADAHAGLGATATVDWIEVRWGDGQVTRVDKPAADRWHTITAPPRKPAP